MATFPRGYIVYLNRVEQAQKLETAAREATTPVRTQVRAPVDPADERTLRGIPAIGRGVAGVIYGTQPGAGLE